MSKAELCLQFIDMDNDSDELLQVVETLFDLTEESITCIYPSKAGCSRNSTTPYGFCKRHSGTKKGKRLTELYDTALEEIVAPDPPESDEEDLEEEPEEEPVEKVEGKAAPSEDEEAEYVPAEEDSEMQRQEEAESTEQKANEDGIVDKENGTFELALTKNKYGMLVHTQSNLVFNFETRTAIGTDAGNGRLYLLTEDDVKFCKKYKIKYQVPR